MENLLKAFSSLIEKKAKKFRSDCIKEGIRHSRQNKDKLAEQTQDNPTKQK